MNSTTIYIHGFLSSPYSNKGKILEQRHLQRGIPFIAPGNFCRTEESRRDNYSCRRSGSNGRFLFYRFIARRFLCHLGSGKV